MPTPGTSSPRRSRHTLTFLTSLAVPLWVLLSVTTGMAEPVFTFAELTDDDLEHIDLHDGRIDDWLQVLGEPSLLARDAYRLVAPVPIRDYDPSDFDFRIWLAWHDATNRIYVAMESVDDHYVNEYDHHGVWGLRSELSDWDSFVNVWVDGDRSGGAVVCAPALGVSDRQRLQQEVEAQQWYGALPETHDNGPHVDLGMGFGVTVDWAVRTPYSDGGGRSFGIDPVFAVLEFYVTAFDHLDIDSPEASRATDLYPGRIVAFTIRVSDRDQDSARRGTYCDETSWADERDLTTLPHAIMVAKTPSEGGLHRLSEAAWGTVKHTAPVDSAGAPGPGD